MSHPRLAGVQRLHQFIQQSPYAVMLLRRTSYGFVAHGADTAHLQPLHQTPVKKNTDRSDIKGFTDQNKHLEFMNVEEEIFYLLLLTL